jgi:hypothetical protein
MAPPRRWDFPIIQSCRNGPQGYRAGFPQLGNYRSNIGGPSPSFVPRLQIRMYRCIAVMDARGRFCCRSDLKTFTNSDSHSLATYCVGYGDDVTSDRRPRSSVLRARFAPRELQAELSEGMVSKHKEMPQIEFSDEDVNSRQMSQLGHSRRFE